MIKYSNKQSRSPLFKYIYSTGNVIYNDLVRSSSGLPYLSIFTAQELLHILIKYNNK